MSKGKYERKRQRAQDRAKEELSHIDLSSSECMEAKDQRKPASNANDHRQVKEEKSVGFREVVKRSSLTDWCLTAFTLMLAVASIYQWNVTRAQLDVMSNDERAWLKFDIPNVGDDPANGAEFSMVVGQPISEKFNIFNVGKTPATDITVQKFLDVYDAEQSPDLYRVDAKDDPKVFPKITAGILFPNDLSFAKQSVFRSGKVVSTQEEVNDYVQGKKYIAVYGIIWYDDVFKVRHWTKFCRFGGSGHYSDNTVVTNTKDCAAFNSVGER